ncbi:uncharacterized protein DUF3380 [Paraburkholderia sp. BL27I4N3]|uniref:N-acetylmuramidase family protein n=1 Tax=Paraburkholderia sp. BL27I4N3 TaxID=1938805 RepID=UPI000E27F83E|nr:N-acetylmuramidase family protein [Paraburkholderia sp. BL27I4N3]REE23498.1 uncharacterized protein DUF3380 [Paraburkholderia sp. BL27I4N3]
MSNHHAHGGHVASHPKTPPSPLVEVTFVFRDVLKHPIAGLAVQVKTGTGAPPAPEWKIGPDTGDSAPATTVVPASGASVPVADPLLPVAPSATVPSNSTETTTDQDGYAVTIQNAARNQPIDVLVKNRRGEYVWKATVKPSKDISAFTIVSPEYHIEATTQLTPKDELEQNLNLPVVKDGEVMTIERLVHDFGPYIGWSQKVTEQGKIKKDIPTRKKEVAEDERTRKKKTKITIEHHYRVVDTGKPQTIAFNLLGSRLNYPKSSILTDTHFSYLGASFGCESAAVKAVTYTETGGRGFDDNGLPRILLERHYVYRLTLPPNKQANWRHEKNPYSKKFPDICFAKYGGYGHEGLHQYERLVKAAAIDRAAALMSCSWGAFQIMGESFSDCGCQTVNEMVNNCMESIDNHVKMFDLFMKNAKPNAIAALRHKDWEAFATAYNGSNWRTQNPHYADNMKANYDKFK